MPNHDRFRCHFATMLANGLDRDSVMKMTGLTADDLAQIRH
ncbi:hypothetical protein [Serratia liquefaciens]